jgi:hypothetical protein
MTDTLLDSEISKDYEKRIDTTHKETSGSAAR